jgi:hypothetical protein
LRWQSIKEENMKNTKNTKKLTVEILLVASLSLVASTVLAQNSQGQNGNSQGQNTGNRLPIPIVCRTCVRAPEINPAEAMGALTLLAGAVAIVRGYRRKQK